MKRLTMLKDDVTNVEDLQNRADSIKEFYDLAIVEDDESLIVLLNVLEEKFLNHKASFYAFWHDLSNQNTHHF